VFDVLQEALEPLGFTVHRMINGEAPDGPVENLFASRGSGGPHLGFAGHLDVVPAPAAAGPATRSRPEIRGGLLYGRGAVDMKSSIASFVAAARSSADIGNTELIITGDEEGPSIHGTRAIMDWMARARDPSRHDRDRRADVGRPPRRHREDRPAAARSTC
jgi:succinyl-diaminopimelate desuccinylase